MWNKIKNLIKVATSLLTDDSGNYQTVTLSFDGKMQRSNSFVPYGLISNPPPNSMALVFQQNAQDSNSISLVGAPKTRTHPLASGVAGIENQMTGKFFTLNADGTATLNVSQLSLLGDLVAINITCSEITINSIPFSTHVHSDPQGGTTGPPQ